jgi:hypothetical protein
LLSSSLNILNQVARHYDREQQMECTKGRLLTITTIIAIQILK